VIDLDELPTPAYSTMPYHPSRATMLLFDRDLA
jgi:hypothetical protein